MPRTSLLLAGTASAVAGVIHLAAVGAHDDERRVALLFLLTAVAQLGWAVLAWQRPGRTALVTGVGLHAGCVAAWVLSRTTGLPVDGLRDAEAVGRADATAAVLAAVALVATAVALVRPAAARTPGLAAAAVVGVVGMLVGVPTAGASHEHAHGHEHQHGDGPIVSVDDPRLTDAQRDAATELIEATAAGMAGFATVDDLEAAGYRSIGDGRRSGFEHFVNPTYLVDDQEVDATAIESIVVQHLADGTEVVASAMYVLAPGSTMADVPDIAGDLTTWHVHDNLCWEGGSVVGVARFGSCRRGELRVSSPMLHVWVVPHECGRFAGIEGAGGADGCGHTH